MKKKKIIIGLIIILITLSLITFISQSFSTTCRKINSYLDCGYVKMGMTKEKLEELMGHTFAKNSVELDDGNLGISLSGNQVNYIRILSSDYSVYGIRIGQSKEEAIQILKKNGFRYDKGHYKKGRIEIILFHDNRIIEIHVTIRKFDFSLRQY